MRILLTGSTGMVGSNILEHPLAAEHEVLAPARGELNLLSQEQIQSYIRKNRPDIIVHAAGVVGGIQANMANQAKFLTENSYMGLNLITAAKSEEVPKLINLASSCMYPRNSTDALSEGQILSGELEPTNEGYALSKILSTRLCEYITAKEPSYQYKTVIPCNLYGRYDKFDELSSHMIPAVIKKIHEAKIKNNKNVDIWGDGTARREFMYAGDLADFIFLAMQRIEDLPQNINVGLGYDFSINEYYEKIAQVIGYEGRFIHDLEKPSGMKRKLVSVELLQNLQWVAKTSLNDGLIETYKYFLNKE